MKTILLALLVSFSCSHAGDFFSTKDNIRARGIDMSFTVPEGMRKLDDDDAVHGWYSKVNGMNVLIILRMYKHHMHTNDEKLEEIKKQERRSPYEQFLHTMRRKIGGEPAVITEYSHEGTNSDGRRVEYQSLELALFPGDTTIKLLCQVSQADFGGEPLRESISAVRPMLLKMLNSVELH